MAEENDDIFCKVLNRIERFLEVNTLPFLVGCVIGSIIQMINLNQ